MSGVIQAAWKLVGMAMLLPVIGNVVYEATFDATESSGRMELRGRASLQVDKRHGVNIQTEIEPAGWTTESTLHLVMNT
jgi:hypothetical protein